MIKINQILKYLKKNIYLVCLIIVLVYIAYDKLYKKEGYEDVKTMNDGDLLLKYIRDFGSYKVQYNNIRDIETDNANFVFDDKVLNGVNIIKGIKTKNPIMIDLTKLTNNRRMWVDINSIRINGSQKLAIVDAREKLLSCDDVNICKKEEEDVKKYKKEGDNCKKERDNCKKETELKSGTLRRCQEDNYKHINKGFFARLFNS